MVETRIEEGTFDERWARATGAAPPDINEPPPAGPFAPPPELARDLTDIQRRQTAQTARIADQSEARMDEDRARMGKAFDATGIGSEELKGFDQQKANEQFMTKPVEAFGSLGVVFAMIASAFTRQPMINALEGSAAALNAIRKHDEGEYTKAFESWKANTDLAVKRHNIQHQAYQDATSLMNVDMNAAVTKMRVQAARFGDEKALAILDRYGMSPELLGLLEARQKQVLGLEQIREKSGLNDERMAKERFKSTLVQKAIDSGEDPERVFNHFYGKERTSEGEALQTLYKEKAAAGEEVTSKDIADLHQKFQRLPASAGLGATNLTVDRQVAQDVAKARKQWEEEGLAPEEIATKAAALTRRLRQQSAPMSGGQRDQIASVINRVDYSLDVLSKTEGLLKKHNMITGLGGTITRPAESVANAIGISNVTDRRQFERYIAELQEWAGRLMNETKGRPLASEASKINAIIGGMRPGDTLANTNRSLGEVKQLYERMRGDLQKRFEGTWNPESKEAPSPKTEGKRPAWMDAPEAK